MFCPNWYIVANAFDAARGEFKDLMRRLGLSEQEYTIQEIVAI